jgi:MFS transporter, ACS family, hexuronate transporter
MKIGNYRWRIVALLFFATTINYIDRQSIAILAPKLQTIFHWNEKDYGIIIMGFTSAYAIGLVTMGGLLDRIGTRLGYIISISIWSLAGMLHAAARDVVSFITVRFILGIGESANFPAAVKTVTEWFPKRERALATGIFNSGTSIGAIITPVMVPAITLKWGWQCAFLVTGALGFIWLIFWIILYKKPELNAHLKDSEREYILQDDHENLEVVPWKKIFYYKQTLGICLARFVTDPIWWFLLYWLPKFFYKTYQIDLGSIGLPLMVIYALSAGGSVFGGWLSSFLIKKGIKPISARKLAIFFLSLLVVPIFFASKASGLWIAVSLITMAAFAHQGYAANIYTIVSDIYPKNAVGSMIGLSGFAGAIGGILFSGAVGLILEFTGSYYVVFGIASVSYLICWLFLKLFVPDDKVIIIK